MSVKAAFTKPNLKERFIHVVVAKVLLFLVLLTLAELEVVVAISRNPIGFIHNSKDVPFHTDCNGFGSKAHRSVDTNDR
jgi:hypothetical protein